MSDQLNPQSVPTPPDDISKLFKGGKPLPTGKPVSIDNTANIDETTEQNILKQLTESTPDFLKDIPLMETEEGKNWKPPTTQQISFESLPEEKQQEILNILKGYQQNQTPDPEENNETENEEYTAPPTDSEEPETEEDKELTTNDVCARCLWPAGKSFDIVPTESDKTNFLVSILGDKDFSKPYNLFNGNMVVTFRTLTLTETQQINTELYNLQKSGVVTTPEAYMNEVMSLRLTASIKQIEVNNHVTYEMNGLEGFLANHAELKTDLTEIPNTDIARLKNYCFKTAINKESVSRAVFSEFKQFQRLVEFMELKSSDPNFWEGAELAG